MHKKQLKRTLDSLGLALVDFKNGTGNSGDIVLRAPDGVEGSFTITRLDDPHSDRININQMRKFASQHGSSGTLPEIAELDVVFLNVTPKPVSDMEAAVQATVLEHDPDTKRYAERVYRKRPLVNPVGMLISGATEPPAPPPAPVPATPDAIERLIATQPARKKTMPKANLTIAAATDKPVRKPKTIDRIGQVEFFKLCTTLNEMDMIGIDTMPKLADKLSKAFGRKISTSTAEDALKATGKKLDKVQVDATDAQVIIARTLTALLTKLSEPVPEELRRLCGEIE